MKNIHDKEEKLAQKLKSNLKRRLQQSKIVSNSLCEDHSTRRLRASELNIKIKAAENPTIKTDK